MKLNNKCCNELGKFCSCLQFLFEAGLPFSDTHHQLLFLNFLLIYEGRKSIFSGLYINDIISTNHASVFGDLLVVDIHQGH